MYKISVMSQNKYECAMDQVL